MGSLKNEEEMEPIGGESSKDAILYVNGVRRVLSDGLGHLTLLEYLRGNVTILTSFVIVWCLRKYRKVLSVNSAELSEIIIWVSLSFWKKKKAKRWRRKHSW
jgi:hypothetical protein